MITEDQSGVVAFLASPSTHGGATVERIDTHSAIVFLAGPRAYKLKGAVRFDYLDFSTSARRRDMCDAEVRLNRRTAPDLYRGVLTVTRGGAVGFALGGSSPPVDWIVEMNRFPQEALFDRLAAAGHLDLDLMPPLAAADLIRLAANLAQPRHQRNRPRKSSRAATDAPRSANPAGHHAPNRHAQQVLFAWAAGSHPQPAVPAALASASLTQHASVLLGAGPPQHESVFRSSLVPLSFFCVFDIVVLLASGEQSPLAGNDEDAVDRKRTQKRLVRVGATRARRTGRRVTGPRKPKMKIGDAAAHVDLYFAAPHEHFAQLLTPTLNPGLHARERDACLPSRIGLCEGSNRREFDSRPIRFRQAADHGGQAGRQFGFGGAHGGLVSVVGHIDLQRICPSVTPLSQPQRIAKSIARDLKQPPFGPFGCAKRIQAADHADEYLLKEIVNVDARRDASRQKGPERRREVVPQRRRVRGNGRRLWRLGRPLGHRFCQHRYTGAPFQHKDAAT
jgi:hypothetical protein